MSPRQRIKHLAWSHKLTVPECAVPEETASGGVALRGRKSNAVYLVRPTRSGLRVAIEHVSRCEARS